MGSIPTSGRLFHFHFVTAVSRQVRRWVAIQYAMPRNAEDVERSALILVSHGPAVSSAYSASEIKCEAKKH